MPSQNRLLLSGLFTPLLLLSINAWAEAGNGTERGGGDPYADEFKQIGLELVERIEAIEKVGIPSWILFRADDVREARGKTLVRSKKRLPRFYDRKYKVWRDVPAINDPKRRTITLSRELWNDLAKTPSPKRAKERLVLHEYVRVNGFPDNEYEVTNPFWAFVDHQDDLQTFRSDFTQAFKQLKQDVLATFQNDSANAQVVIASARMSSDYQRCSNPKASMKNRGDLEACFLVSVMMLQAMRTLDASKNAVSARQIGDEFNGTRERIRRCFRESKDPLADLFHCLKMIDDLDRIQDQVNGVRNPVQDAIDAYKTTYAELSRKIENVPQPFRKAVLGRLLHYRIHDALQAANEKLESFSRTWKENMDKSCPLSLNKSILCALDHAEAFLQNQWPNEILAQRRSVELVFDQGLAEIAAYDER